MTARQPSLGGSIRLRPPLWTRIYTLGFGLLWCGLLITFAVRAPHRQAPIAAGMLVFGILLIGSILRLTVTTTGDRLLIRNHLTTTALTRQEIEGFRAGPAANQGLPLTWCAYALSTQGRVIPLAVTARVGIGHPPRHVDDDVSTLQQWLTDNTRPHPAQPPRGG